MIRILENKKDYKKKGIILDPSSIKKDKIPFTVRYKKHWWHIVTPSPWPFLLSLGMYPLPVSLVAWMHGYENSFWYVMISFLYIITCTVLWFRDIIREGTFEGKHTKGVQANLLIGFSWFIFSEVMFFASFFWAYFHSAISPTPAIGCTWPPTGMEGLLFNPWGVPFLNTCILLLSGSTITLSHWYLRAGDRTNAYKWCLITVLLALNFIGWQFMEYKEARFDISDGIYGSTFFMLTGFHGFHVILGMIMLVICAYRIKQGHFSRRHHIGFITSAWYWHFVDVVWLFVFGFVYVWGSEMVYYNVNVDMI